MMKLRDKLFEMKQEAIATKPPELLNPILKGAEELIQAGIADKAIPVGEILPEFILPDEQGNLVSSKYLLAKGPLAISFYRGIW